MNFTQDLHRESTQIEEIKAAEFYQQIHDDNNLRVIDPKVENVILDEDLDDQQLQPDKMIVVEDQPSISSLIQNLKLVKRQKSIELPKTKMTLTQNQSAASSQINNQDHDEDTVCNREDSKMSNDEKGNSIQGESEGLQLPQISKIINDEENKETTLQSPLFEESDTPKRSGFAQSIKKTSKFLHSQQRLTRSAVKTNINFVDAQEIKNAESLSINRLYQSNQSRKQLGLGIKYKKHQQEQTQQKVLLSNYQYNLKKKNMKDNLEVSTTPQQQPKQADQDEEETPPLDQKNQQKECFGDANTTSDISVGGDQKQIKASTQLLDLTQQRMLKQNSSYRNMLTPPVAGGPSSSGCEESPLSINNQTYSQAIGGTQHIPPLQCSDESDHFAKNEDLSLTKTNIDSFKQQQLGGESDQRAIMETCNGGRFIKHQGFISQSQYRTIYRGYDNESGCEIAWNVYSLQNVNPSDRDKINMILNQVKELRHQNIISCKFQMMKETELVMITELITAGSIREYLKRIKLLPRLIVIKNWAKKILEGVAYLHSKNFVHGKLTCESIYINSNNGDIKIGDIGVYAIPCYNSKYSELQLCKQLNNSEQSTSHDIYCFGLSLLEIISSDISGTKAFQILCKIINKEEKQLVLSSIMDDQLRDIISISLESDPAKRATLTDLQNHPFWKSDNDHSPVVFSVKLSELIQKYSHRRNTAEAKASSASTLFNQSSILDSNTSSYAIDQGTIPKVIQDQKKKKEEVSKKTTVKASILAGNNDGGDGIEQDQSPASKLMISSKNVNNNDDIITVQTGGAILPQDVKIQDTRTSSFSKQVNKFSEFVSQEPSQTMTNSIIQKLEPDQTPYISEGTTFKINHTTFGQSPIQSTLNSPLPQTVPLTPQQLQEAYKVVVAPSTGATTFLMHLNVYSSKRLLTVSFPFDLEQDTPEQIVNEMRNELKVSSEGTEINALQDQIRKVVNLVKAAGNDGGGMSGGNYTLSTIRGSAHSPEGGLRRRQSSVSDQIVKTSPQRERQASGNSDTTGQNLPADNTNEQDMMPGGEQEAIIIEERGGAQEHHNQTMDEMLYHHHHQSTKRGAWGLGDEDGGGQMIQCNVVSNPINFMNSMILHDKNDLNDPAVSPGEHEIIASLKIIDQSSKQQQVSILKKEIQDLKKPQAFKDQPDIDEVSELDDNVSLGNLLHDLFPGYQDQHLQLYEQSQYQHAQHKQNPNLQCTSLNETLNLSHQSLKNDQTSNVQSPPITQHSNLGTNNDHFYGYIDHNFTPELSTIEQVDNFPFTEGMNSFNFNQNSTLNKNHQQVQNQQLISQVKVLGTSALDRLHQPKAQLFSKIKPVQQSSNNLSQSNDNSRLLFKKNLTQFLSQSLKKTLEVKKTDKKDLIQLNKGGEVDTFNGGDGVATTLFKNLQAALQSNSDQAPNSMVTNTPYFLTPKTSMNPSSMERNNEQLNVEPIMVIPSEIFIPHTTQQPGNDTPIPSLGEYDKNLLIQQINQTNQQHLIQQQQQSEFNLVLSHLEETKESNRPINHLDQYRLRNLNSFPLVYEKNSQTNMSQQHNQDLHFDHTPRGNVTMIRQPSPTQKHEMLFVQQQFPKQNSFLVESTQFGKLQNVKQVNRALNDDTEQQVREKKMKRFQVTNSNQQFLEDQDKEINGDKLPLMQAQLLSQEYFNFDNHNHSQQNNTLDSNEYCEQNHNQKFKKEMKSTKMHRKNKEMYKGDISKLQDALKRIYRVEDVGREGHFCDRVSQLVKKFQETYSYQQDGIVDRVLWNNIMTEAIRSPCPLCKGYNISINNEAQLMHSGTMSSSNFDHQSTHSIYSPLNSQLHDAHDTPPVTYTIINLNRLKSSTSSIDGTSEGENLDLPSQLIQPNMQQPLQQAESEQQEQASSSNGQVDIISLQNEEIRLDVQNINKNVAATSTTLQGGNSLFKTV